VVELFSKVRRSFDCSWFNEPHSDKRASLSQLVVRPGRRHIVTRRCEEGRRATSTSLTSRSDVNEQNLIDETLRGEWDFHHLGTCESGWDAQPDGSMSLLKSATIAGCAGMKKLAAVAGAWHEFENCMATGTRRANCQGPPRATETRRTTSHPLEWWR
jgi:hypothetical protein